MGRIARESGRLPAATHRALERFCARLENFIAQPPAPGLVHGDVWAGNVLCAAERVAAFITTAIYFADPEVAIDYLALRLPSVSEVHPRSCETNHVPPEQTEGRQES